MLHLMFYNYTKGLNKKQFYLFIYFLVGFSVVSFLQLA